MAITRRIDVDRLAQEMVYACNLNKDLAAILEVEKLPGGVKIVNVKIFNKDQFKHKLEIPSDEMVVAITPFNGHLLTLSAKRIAIWDVQTNKSRTILDLPKSLDKNKLGLEFDARMLVTPSGNILTSHPDGSVYLWDLEKREPELLTKVTSYSRIPYLEFLPNGKLFIHTANSNPTAFLKRTNRLEIWDLTTKKNQLLHEFEGRPFVACAVLSDNRVVFSRERTVFLIEIDKKEENPTPRELLQTGWGDITHLKALTKDQFVFVDQENSLKVWDIPTNSSILTLANAGIAQISDLTITPDLQLLGTTVRGICYWDVGLQKKMQKEYEQTRQAMVQASADWKLPTLPNPLFDLIGEYAVASRTSFGLFAPEAVSSAPTSNTGLQKHIDLLHAETPKDKNQPSS